MINIKLICSASFFLAGLSSFVFGGTRPPVESILFEGMLAEDSTANTDVPDGPIDLVYPIEDREGDFVNDPVDNPFYLDDPPTIEKNVEYDPNTNQYIITEMIGDQHYRPPMYMTYEEYLEYTLDQSMQDYWDSRESAADLLEGEGKNPLLDKLKKDEDKDGSDFMKKVANLIEIRPQGNIDLTLGANFQKIGNPTLTEQQRKQGGFDFDMNINMNVLGKIGDIVELNVKYNTEATFDFDNQIKLQYEGKEDDIIKKIEAGNVSFPLPTTLIQGSQTLFGVKTQLQFGRLTMTNVVSQQKSKKESIVIEGGAQMQEFEVQADDYDANRHFFLSQFFRDNYNDALSSLPVLNSLVNITRLEVWVTNRTGETRDVRDVVAFMDLGESDPYSGRINSLTNDNRPNNDANDLYRNLSQRQSDTRSLDRAAATIQSQMNLTPVQDFEKTYAEKLTSSEYTFHQNLGFISLRSTLSPNQVLGVAFQYTYNGDVFQVGEFASDVPVDSTSGTKMIFLKMLKSTSVRPNLPIWNLMMKNVYPLGAFQISQEDFKLDIYYNDPGGGQKRYIPRGQLRGIPLIRLLNLDNLNNQGDAQPDGIFDFVPGITMNPSNGRFIFPLVEPFGDDLREQFVEAGSGQIADQFVYDQLYDSTKVQAQQHPEFNRFIIRGTYKGSSGSDISLGAFNIPEGSVTVSLGGQQLVEGQHYTVDYNLGRVKIIDEAIINSGNQVKIDFENNALFGFQIKTLYGSRLDYRISDDFKIGGTVMRMAEKPFTEKVNVGDDPIKNTIMGLDFSYSTEAPVITRILDKLPVYDTKETSTVSLTGEVAHLRPGHSRQINNEDKEGVVYIDDFEGTSSGWDLKFPAISWRLASTPNGSPGPDGQVLFPEASNISDLSYGFNRAKLAWYNIDPLFTRNNTATPGYLENNAELQLNHFAREIRQNEVFPNKDLSGNFNTNLLTFDLAYYPDERGPYNFDVLPSQYSAGISSDGKLKRPETRWGGIMRGIDNNDFEASNIEFIEFWMLDPFVYDPTQDDGQMYIHLGNVAEDVLKDSRLLYENGLREDTNDMDATTWGYVPRTPPITNAFDNNTNARAYQDVGFDGIDDDVERIHYGDYLNEVQSVLNPTALSELQADPAGDNYRHYRDDTYDDEQAAIPNRYKQFNGPDGNSPTSSGNAVFSSAATNLPDAEDLNRDNTLNETEEYFQYKIDLFPGMDVANHPYIVSKVENQGFVEDGVQVPDYNWFQFRIPVKEFDDRVGNIPDFKSIQFIRMALTGFEDSIHIRFGTLELIRNQWRRYLLSMQEAQDVIPSDNFNETFFNVASVNIEENSEKEPVNYVIPPNIVRERGLGSSSNQTVLQNEQALSVEICNLPDGDSRAVYKNIDFDFRKYKSLRMFVHAESVDGETPLDKGDITAFARLGSDFRDNFYQYEIPLEITPAGNYAQSSEDDRKIVWPDSNQINFSLDELIRAKLARDDANWPLNIPFSLPIGNGKLITIKGNPDIGLVKTIMLGVKNPAQDDPLNPLAPGDDDGQPKCAELWFNELRLSGLDEDGGTAALATLDVKLADLGNLNFSTNMHTIGFGQIEQKVDERYRDNFYQYDLSASLELGKFIPENVGIRLPFYGSISQSFSTPEYDPYALDVPLNIKIDQLKAASNDTARKYKRQVQDIITRKSFNFTNVRRVNPNKKGDARFYDVENLNFTYAYTSIEKSDPFIKSDFIKTHLASMGYNHSPSPKYLYPFKKAINSKSKWFNIIKDMNVNFFPSNLSFNTVFDRQFGELRLRSLGDEEFPIEPSYNKYFNWDRTYGFKYNPFKSFSIDYAATNRARIDEPEGRIDTDEKKKEIWDNIFKGGRTVNFNQSLNVSYNVPINKIPILDWIQVRTGYNSTYNWAAAPQQVSAATGELEANSLGNTIMNTQNVRINGDFNFKNLYNKVPFLKNYNSGKSSLGNKETANKKKQSTKKAREKIDKDIEKLQKQLTKLKGDLQALKGDGSIEKAKKKKDIAAKKAEIKKVKENIKKKKKDKRKKQRPSNPGIAVVVQPLLALKKVSVNYSENKSTTLPGYMGATRFLGIDKNFGGPGYGFVFGGQPGNKKLFGFGDEDQRDLWLEDAAAEGWLTNDTLLNYRFTQTASQNFDAKVTVEPWRDLRVDLDIKRNYSQNHSQLFKRVTEGGTFEHLNPIDMGSYTISYLTWKTVFDKLDEQGVNDTYRNFENNRQIISDRLGVENPNSQGIYYNQSDSIFNQNFAEGYGPSSQDVLIPAFLAAYSGQDAQKVNLNPFNTIPRPNWRLTYNGLSKFEWAKKIFNSFSISHGYSSTVSVNSFETELRYQGDGDYTNPSAVDSFGNFYSLLNIPNIVINEQLSPLIGVDITWKNNLTTRFDYKKSRTLTMSFIDYQLREMQSTQITLGVGYKIKGLNLPIKVKGKKLRLDNDLNFKFDFSLRDNVTINHRLDQDISEPTSGSKNISVNPSIDYTVSKRLNIRIFMNRSRTIPKTSASFPITSTQAGINIRFSLAE